MAPGELQAAGEKLFGRHWQAQMARRLRVDVSTVRRWKNGESEVPGPAEVALELMLEMGKARESRSGLPR